MLARTWAWLFLAGAALLTALVVLAATFPSGDYLFLPNEASPVANRVAVEGEGAPDPDGGIYYVDVRLKKARWLERLVPFLRPDGASLVPGHAVTAPGQSFADRIATARDEMDHWSGSRRRSPSRRGPGENVDARPARRGLDDRVAAAEGLRCGNVDRDGLDERPPGLASTRAPPPGTRRPRRSAPTAPCPARLHAPLGKGCPGGVTACAGDRGGGTGQLLEPACLGARR